jgi:hypothetical protein
MVMSAAAVLAAFAVVMLAVVIAGGFGAKRQIVMKQRFHRLIGASGHAAVQRDARFRKGPLGAVADSAADERVDLQLFQQIGQRPCPLPLVLTVVAILTSPFSTS